MKSLFVFVCNAVFACCNLFLVNVGAEVGVTDKEILLGQSTKLLDKNQLSLGYRDGALLYFNFVNQSGGVHGRQIKLISLDDEGSAEKAADNARKLISEHKVMLLFGFVRTPVVKAAMPIAHENKVPLFGSYTGFDELYENKSRYIFTNRASFEDELNHIIRFLGTTGISRIAMASYDNKVGTELVEGVKAKLAKYNLKLLDVGYMKIYSKDATEAVKKLKDTQAQALIMGPSGDDAVAFIRAYDKVAAERPTYFARSLVNARQLISDLGDQAQGVSVTQTAPNPYKATALVAKEYRKLLQQKAPGAVPDYIELEGFIAAKTLVEGLRRAGSNLTREKLIDALETMNDFDLGGYPISYTKKNHHGSKYVDLTYIGRGGRTFD